MEYGATKYPSITNQLCPFAAALSIAVFCHGRRRTIAAMVAKLHCIVDALQKEYRTCLCRPPPGSPTTATSPRQRCPTTSAGAVEWSTNTAASSTFSGLPLSRFPSEDSSFPSSAFGGATLKS